MTLTARAGRLWLFIAVVTTGCGGASGFFTAPLRMRQPFDDADALVLAGRYPEAREAYTAILTNGTDADRALLGLARLGLDPTNADRDDRQAAAYLDRLIAQYPRSPSVPEARTWGSLLHSVGRLKREVRRQQNEVERLRRTLQREQQETARLREERERLTQVDVEFERPRLLPGPSTSAPSLLRLPE
jgi:hypothetical protein